MAPPQKSAEENESKSWLRPRWNSKVLLPRRLRKLTDKGTPQLKALDIAQWFLDSGRGGAEPPSCPGVREARGARGATSEDGCPQAWGGSQQQPAARPGRAPLHRGARSAT